MSSWINDTSEEIPKGDRFSKTCKEIYEDYTLQHGEERTMNPTIMCFFSDDLFPADMIQDYLSSDRESPIRVTRDDGWTIEGHVTPECCLYRTNRFLAQHPIYGMVWGDPERVVYAHSEEDYHAFTKDYEFYRWNGF